MYSTCWYGSVLTCIISICASVGVCLSSSTLSKFLYPHEISHENLKMDGAILKKHIAAGACSPAEINRSGNRRLSCMGMIRAATDQELKLACLYNLSLIPFYTVGLFQPSSLIG